MLRIFLLSLICICLSCVAAIVFTQNGDIVYMIIFLVGNSFIPLMIAAYIFYLLLDTRQEAVKSFSQKMFTGLAHLFICQALLIIWALGEWIIGGPGGNDLLQLYKKEYLLFNFVLIIHCVLLPCFHFLGVFSSLDTRARDKNV